MPPAHVKHVAVSRLPRRWFFIGAYLLLLVCSWVFQRFFESTPEAPPQEIRLVNVGSPKGSSLPVVVIPRLPDVGDDHTLSKELIVQSNGAVYRMTWPAAYFQKLRADSSAHDIAILVTEALKQDYMRRTTVIKHTEIEVPGKKKSTKIQINNTNNPLLGAYDSAVLSKTGLTSKAGWCVAMALEQEGQQYIIVVLGAKNKAERTKMVERSFNNFTR